MIVILLLSFPALAPVPCTTADPISEIISNSSPNLKLATSFLISDAILGVLSLIGVNRLSSSFLGVPGIIGEIFLGDTMEDSGLEDICSHMPVKSTRLLLL